MLLRAQFGISAREALAEIPEWEYVMLVAAGAEQLHASQETHDRDG